MFTNYSYFKSYEIPLKSHELIVKKNAAEINGFSLRPINKNEEIPSQIDPRYHPRASDSGAECEEDPNDSDALRVPAPGRKVVFK